MHCSGHCNAQAGGQTKNKVMQMMQRKAAAANWLAAACFRCHRTSRLLLLRLLLILFLFCCCCWFRLKAALRRCDVRDADDYDEEEYRQASRAVGEHTYAIIKVRLCAL